MSRIILLPTMGMAKRACILVVDDQPDNRLILEDLLDSTYDVRCADGGHAALAALAEQPVDMVLLDIMMPDMDGFDVCRAIKANPATADIPVLFVSGRDKHHDEALGLSLGAADFIHKPFSGPVVLARIRSHLQLSGARRELLHKNEELDHRIAVRTAELAQSEARFRQLTAMSSDFFWETDSEHRFTLRTASHRESLDPEINLSSFLGMARWEVPHLSPDAATWAAHRTLLDTHQSFRHFEISREGGNGNVIHVSVSGDPVFDDAGQFTGYRGTGTDITERRQAEEALRLAAAAFDSQQPMIIADAKLLIQRVNQAFLKSTGFEESELVGKPMRVLKSGRHDASFYQSLWDEILRHGYWQGEIWGLRKDHSTFPKLLTISTVKGVDGKTTHYVGSYLDLTHLKQQEQEIEHLAFYDQLTGLPNRILLQDRLLHATAFCGRNGRIGAVLTLDVDNFKTLNDTRGHYVGDLLLKQFAEKLVPLVRQTDTVARVSGNEFVVVLTDILADQSLAEEGDLLRKCRSLLEQLSTTYTLNDEPYQCSVSIGVTLIESQKETPTDHLRRAELALHHAKADGGHQIVRFEPSMETAVLHRLRMENDLRRAIDAREFELHYQPQVDGLTGAVLGAEALIRWRDPQRGMVPPNDFISHAERTGLIVPIGLWVIETACDHLAAWASHPEMANLVIAVNVSAQQFLAPGFQDTVANAIARTGANPHQLKLELTESMLASNAELVIDTMRKLKSLGVGFSLDDFGTGYSSLSYLSRLPLDQLKIDRSFVNRIESGDNNVVICAATISLARSLNLKVVAEGVETDAQRYFLSVVHKCEMHQGYLYSKPLPHRDFEHYCLTRNNKSRH